MGSFLHEEGIRIARGLVPGTISQLAFGFNASVSTNWETIHTPGNLILYPSTAGVVSITTTDSQNNPEGTGAGFCNIRGLDANFNMIEETVTLDGTNTVTSENEFIRVNRACLDCVLGDSKLTGTLSATINGNQIFAIDSQYDNTALRAVYTVPAGHDGFIHQTLFNHGRENQSALIGLFVRPFERSFRLLGMYETFQGVVIDPNYQVPIKVPEKTDIEIRMRSLSGTVSGAATLGLIIVRNRTYDT